MLHLPTIIEEFLKSEEHFITKESINKALCYQPQSLDIFIVTHMKCGTTWMQQISHGLRSHGSMNFDEIFEVVPWFEVAYDVGVDILQPQVNSPHLFKTHLPLSRLPQGGKYIVIIREPKDVLLSDYYFQNGSSFEKDSISLIEFAQQFYFLENNPIGDASLWKHIQDFWNYRKNVNVLALCYEHIKNNLPETVKLVANFMGINLTPDLQNLVVIQSSADFMYKHKEKFDEHIVLKSRDDALDCTGSIRQNKVNADEKLKYSHINKETLSDIQYELEKMWQRKITDVFGLQSYTDILKERMSLYQNLPTVG
ncbi:Sulfotransferase [Gammaproteobacteria bacterium]